jgi:hypothetical protein
MRNYSVDSFVFYQEECPDDTVIFRNFPRAVTEQPATDAARISSSAEQWNLFFQKLISEGLLRLTQFLFSGFNDL